VVTVDPFDNAGKCPGVTSGGDWQQARESACGAFPSNDMP
jgi:hypothetical protein